MTDQNFWDLFSQPTDDEQLRKQIVALRSMVISLSQEVDALRCTLTETGQLDQKKFRTIRKFNMLQDHSSQGCNPWMGYSYYRFIVREEEYLRRWLGFSAEEVEKYQRERQEIQCLT